ncbi:Protein of unknown function [Bacillus toyonensis]|jgi:hypothetical protein
MELK